MKSSFKQVSSSDQRQAGFSGAGFVGDCNGRENPNTPLQCIELTCSYPVQFTPGMGQSPEIGVERPHWPQSVPAAELGPQPCQSTNLGEMQKGSAPHCGSFPSFQHVIATPQAVHRVCMARSGPTAHL